MKRYVKSSVISAEKYAQDKVEWVEGQFPTSDCHVQWKWDYEEDSGLNVFGTIQLADMLSLVSEDDLATKCADNDRGYYPENDSYNPFCKWLSQEYVEETERVCIESGLFDTEEAAEEMADAIVHEIKDICVDAIVDIDTKFYDEYGSYNLPAGVI